MAICSLRCRHGGQCRILAGREDIQACACPSEWIGYLCQIENPYLAYYKYKVVLILLTLGAILLPLFLYGYRHREKIGEKLKSVKSIVQEKKREWFPLENKEEEEEISSVSTASTAKDLLLDYSKAMNTTCMNGGTMFYSKRHSMYYCRCPEGFLGTICNIEKKIYCADLVTDQERILSLLQDTSLNMVENRQETERFRNENYWMILLIIILILLTLFCYLLTRLFEWFCTRTNKRVPPQNTGIELHSL
ncbi:hypothetical protein QR680_016057 [Steinernema hermaphroditum]|uniref:EGF-like domain-containing protein n=1 Tax=Steinernema hermaphroditum TaxID=289476 RepID=A0AA39HCF2_9BILA|nr:hypothetical protein QR680_016057 [Steinernema hermaphroditum]